MVLRSQLGIEGVWSVKVKMMRLLHAERHWVARLGVRLGLSRIAQDLLIFEADDYSKLLRELSVNQYDFLLLDDSVPGGEGFRMIKRIKRCQSGITILVFADVDEATFGRHYIAEGADGFLSKSASLDEFHQAFFAVTSGGRYISERSRRGLLTSLVGYCADADNPLMGLNATQLLIADMLAKGKMVKEIASMLQVAQNTVSFHKAQLYSKIGVQTPFELYQVMRAHRYGSASFEVPVINEKQPILSISSARNSKS